MFDDIELENCPDKFAFNCKRYAIKCHECKANNKGKHLLYLPINKSITPHPVESKPKKKKTSYSRKGKAEEQKTINNSDILKRTIGSGSYVGDGDAYIELGPLGRVRVEHKTRFANRNIYNPTSTEILEGKNQGIKVWYIKNKSSLVNYNNFVVADYNLMAHIFKVIFTSDKLKIMKDTYLSHCYTLWYQPVINENYGPIDIQYFHTNIKRGMSLSKKQKNDLGYYIMFVAKTNYGKYCYLTSNLFEKLIKLYMELL